MGELIYGKGGWGACSSHPALLGGGKCVSSPSSWPASGNAAQGSVTNPGSSRGSLSTEGESGDLQGSRAGGLEAAPGCKVRSTSPFLGLHPNTPSCLAGYLSSYLSIPPLFPGPPWTLDLC